MRLRLSLLLAVSTLGFALFAPRALRADDNMFPPAPAAKASINFDAEGFTLNGNRTFIVAASVHYPRMPRAQWRERLLRVKRGGFNTVETYLFWNVHEAQEGKFNFTGEADLDAFLKLTKEMGLYCIVRIGPYICGEWDSGGFPVWLRFKPGITVRVDNAPYLAAVDRYFEHILPIVVKNQINRGGSVIMAQVENEHSAAWGIDMPNPYFKHLHDKVLALGLEVPFFFSGLHHGTDPAGGNPWDSKGRVTPWFSSEFWPGWYDRYGAPNPGTQRIYDRANWKLIAYGGCGYSYYMTYGGSNFETWNSNEDSASYDFGAPIGQGGDIRPGYYKQKRAALFARSFQEILETSINSTDKYRDAVEGPVRVTARSAPAGTILFLDNAGDAPLRVKIKDMAPAGRMFTVAPGEILPLVKDAQLTPQVRIEAAVPRISSVVKEGDACTLVVSGAPGDDVGMAFHIGASAFKILRGAPDLTRDADNEGRILLVSRIPENGVRDFAFTADKQTVRILLMTLDQSDRTWSVEGAGHSYLLSGADYVGETLLKAGKLQFALEAPLKSTRATEAPLLFRAADVTPPKVLVPVGAASGPAEPVAPLLGAWETRAGGAEAAPQFNDSKWLASDAPLAMGADGDTSAFAWYRTRVVAPKAGDYTLRFSRVGDRATVFVNGAMVSRTDPHTGPAARNVDIVLREGVNTLAVFTAHYGRDKIYNYYGPLDKIDAKGISGPVMLVPKGQVNTLGIARWSYLRDDRGESAAAELTAPNLNTTDWKTAGREDVFHDAKGFVWFRAVLPDLKGPGRSVHFDSVDDNAVVYLNGKELGRHLGWNDPFTVQLDSEWRLGAPNVLAVLVENISGPGGILGQVEPNGRGGAHNDMRGWKMRGGLAGAQAFLPLKPAAISPKISGAPTLCRTHFNLPPAGGASRRLVLRFSPHGLSRGTAWLNGHNLGRYPDRIVDGLYLPEAWQIPGRNTLVIFDEEGAAPDAAALRIEETASVNLSEWSEPAK